MLSSANINFYGTGNEPSCKNVEVILEKNESVTKINGLDNRNSAITDKPLSQNDDKHQNTNKDGIGKWVNPEREKRGSTEPYPISSDSRRYSYKEKKYLPRQLKELFTPLKCNLCNCTMGSTATAKDHYEGKKHKASIKKWLTEHPEYCGRVAAEEYESQPKVFDPDRLYCKYCDVMLSSEQQARSHYVGKKHQNIVNKAAIKSAQSDPTKEQFKHFLESNNARRFGIGLAFLNDDDKKEHTQVNQKLFCEVCQIVCPSEITFHDHLGGLKHKKRMLLLHNSETSSTSKDNILDDVVKGEKKLPVPTDLSIYRTPSGKYYCYPCNVTVNSQIQFLQHSESRRHKNRSISAACNKVIRESRASRSTKARR